MMVESFAAGSVGILGTVGLIVGAVVGVGLLLAGIGYGISRLVASRRAANSNNEAVVENDNNVEQTVEVELVQTQTAEVTQTQTVEVASTPSFLDKVKAFFTLDGFRAFFVGPKASVAAANEFGDVAQSDVPQQDVAQQDVQQPEVQQPEVQQPKSEASSVMTQVTPIYKTPEEMGFDPAVQTHTPPPFDLSPDATAKIDSPRAVLSPITEFQEDPASRFDSEEELNGGTTTTTPSPTLLLRTVTPPISANNSFANTTSTEALNTSFIIPQPSGTDTSPVQPKKKKSRGAAIVGAFKNAVGLSSNKSASTTTTTQDDTASKSSFSRKSFTGSFKGSFGRTKPSNN